jgi:hypothetical protein
MTRILSTIAFALLFLSTATAADKARLLVLTDIGEDPDDQQSMIRLMVHANEFDIEGLIATAVNPSDDPKKVVRPELIHEIVEAYSKVRSNLVRHHPDFPEAKKLLDCVKSGNPKRGMESVGDGKDTDGSNWIIKATDRDDKRPLNIVIWGAPTDLAQALWKVRDERKHDEAKFLGKLRVYSIGHQDNTGPWIVREFPDLFYILSKAPAGRDMREGGYRGMYLGGDESLTSREWVDRHVRKDHGPLGALYPTSTWTAPNPHSTLKEGDTPSWFYFLPIGLSDPAYPDWGCWGGRFKKVTDKHFQDDRDTVKNVTEARANVYRWRPAFQNEFAARMDWCVKPPKEANHPPTVVLNNDTTGKPIVLEAKAGEQVKLSAAGSIDSDGNKLTYHWWIYREAGTYAGGVNIDSADREESKVIVPTDAIGKTIHVVLEVTDDGKPRLTRYRRAVISVR